VGLVPVQTFQDLGEPEIACYRVPELDVLLQQLYELSLQLLGQGTSPRDSPPEPIYLMLHVDDENELLIRLAYGRGVDGEIL
jgi:hypothetical protein